MTQQKSSEKDRIRDVYEMILQGHSRTNIEQFCRQNWDSDSEPLILSALEIFGKESKTSYDVQMGWCMESLKDLYRKSVEIGDFPAATRCVKEVADLAKRLKIHNKKQ